jgi:hypothetical protein
VCWKYVSSTVLAIQYGIFNLHVSDLQTYSSYDIFMFVHLDQQLPISCSLSHGSHPSLGFSFNLNQWVFWILPVSKDVQCRAPCLDYFIYVHSPLEGTVLSMHSLRNSGVADVPVLRKRSFEKWWDHEGPSLVNELKPFETGEPGLGTPGQRWFLRYWWMLIWCSFHCGYISVLSHGCCC